MIYIIKVWKFIKGYVIINIKGFNITKLINKSVDSDIHILDLKVHNKGKYYSGCIHSSQIEKFRLLAQKNNCTMKCINSSIFDICCAGFKYKILYILGFFMFLFITYLSASLVWIIDIEGNKIISKEQIINSCINNSLYIGSPLKKIDGKIISDNLKNQFGNISWINISTDGTCVHIRLAEGSDKIVQKGDNIPCNIVSNTDGIISDIVTDYGMPLVKKNDVVSEGDILISGELKNSGTEEIIINDYVQAKGTVKAYVTREHKFSIPLLQSEKFYSGNKLTKYSIKLWNMDFADKRKINYKNYDYTKTTKQIKLKENVPLPIIFNKFVYRECYYRDKIINIEEAKNIANEEILSYIVNNYPVSADIISCETSYKEYNNKLNVNVLITSDEIIGIYQEINQPGGNISNDKPEASNTR